MKEKLSNRLAAAILRDFRLENIEWSKCQVIFVTEEEIFSKPFLSCLNKNCLIVSLISSTCIFFCRKTVHPVFISTHFVWLPTRFRKCSETQLIRGRLAF